MQVTLFEISKDGFNKKVSAAIDATGGLSVSSHAFDREGYDREFDLAVNAENVPALCTVLGLRPDARPSDLLAELRARFNTIRCDSDIADFVNAQGVEAEQSSYSRFPDR